MDKEVLQPSKGSTEEHPSDLAIRKSLARAVSVGGWTESRWLRSMLVEWSLKKPGLVGKQDEWLSLEGAVEQWGWAVV